IYRWVESGVVIHLHLAIEFAAALAGFDLGQQGVEASPEIVALLFEDGEPGGVAQAMLCRGRLAVGFDAGVEDLEAEDGEAVDNQARALGVERSCRVLGGEVAEEP